MNVYLNLVGLFFLGAILLPGSLIVSAFWKNLADRHGDPRVVAFAQKALNYAELLFTLPGTLLLIGSSAGIALLNNLDFTTVWTQTAGGLFGAFILVWLLLLFPLQMKQTRIAREFASGGVVPDHYWKSCRHWNRLRTIQTLLIFCVLAIVIFKPV